MNFLSELAARRRFGMKPGLDTIRALCAALGHPERRFKTVHVAGTNGKGAVCAMLAAGLASAGKIGRYTSPHLVRLNERFVVNGEVLEDAPLEAAANAVERIIAGARSPELEEVTFFEALTAVAFRVFADAACDYVVLETGLGGRLDATNVCTPELSVITRIGLDHCDWLGDTVEKIAAEKAGIIKPGVPIVLGANLPAVRAVVAARAREVGAPFHYAPELASAAEIPAGFSLSGSFNRENAVTALAALKVLAAHSTVALPSVDFLTRVIWPGRFQRTGAFIVDGAHNPPAATALAAALGETGERYELIAGFCGDKDVESTLRILRPFVKRATAVRTNNPRSLTAAETAAKMRSVGMEATAATSLKAAIAASSGPTLICGSLFLAGEALVELGAYPWPSPRFDPAELLTRG